jgi:Tfp pilus assembly protein PilO
MRRSHGFLVFVLMVALIAFAWWRGWFSLNQENIDRDKEKAQQELKQGADKVREEAEKLKNRLQKDPK